MALEDYFDFLDPLDIRIKGHRIGIDDVLYYYLKGYSPAAILEHYPSLNLEKIEAVIAYYHQHQSEVDEYLRAQQAWVDQQHQEQHDNVPDVVERIRAKLAAPR